MEEKIFANIPFNTNIQNEKDLEVNLRSLIHFCNKANINLNNANIHVKRDIHNPAKWFVNISSYPLKGVE